MIFTGKGFHEVFVAVDGMVDAILVSVEVEDAVVESVKESHGDFGFLIDELEEGRALGVGERG